MIKFSSINIFYFVTLLLLISGMDMLQARPSHTIEGTGPVTDYREFLFLYEYTRSYYEKEYVVRPILPVYSNYKNYDRDYYFRSTIFPLFYWNGTHNWTRWSFLDLITGDSRYQEDDGKDTDLIIPPLFWGRGESEKEKYFAVFPLGGNIKHKFSWDEISFVLWPLYTSWSYKDYKAHSILWPIFMTGSSKDRHDFRMLFVYSSKVHDGKYNRKSVLWPFFQWGSEGLNKKDPRHYVFFFPFYGRKWSDSGSLSAHTVLWPFFSWGSDSARGATNVRLFWFLYQYDKNNNPYIRRHIVFPFWGHYRFGTEEQDYWKEMNFYTPLYLTLRTHSRILESEQDYYGIFLYQKMHTYYNREEATENYYKLWPFFHYKNDTRGDRNFSMLSLWPFRSEDIERLWAPVISGSLFEYKYFRNRDHYFSILLRLFSRRWNEYDEHIFLAGFEYHRTRDRWSLELLGGLLGVGEKKIEEDREEWFYRILWMEI